MKEQLIEITRRAGQEILKYYGKDSLKNLKQDNSPLTLADLASEKIIIDGLRKYFPKIGIVSEETVKEIGCQKYFLVDPLDGTKEFLAQNGEFVISIGLIEDGYPILGILYKPVDGIIYFAEKGKGAYKYDEIQNSFKLAVRAAGSELVQLISHRHSISDSYTFPDYRLFKNFKPIKNSIKVGSAYKFGYLAEANADVYPRVEPLYEWDTAAGQIIVEESGGIVMNLDGSRLSYGNPNFQHKGFVALGKSVYIS